MTATTTDRIFNFSAGPCTLPLEVLQQAADELPNYQNNGASLIEMSHRSKQVVSVFEEATQGVRDVLCVPDDMHILFIGGGATFQFGMIPMNLLPNGKSADYIHSGAWSKKAIADAKAVGNVNLLFDGSDSNFTTLPDATSIKASDDAAYLHVCSNETIGGVQFTDYPDVDVPIVADMSSEITSRPIDYDKFGLIYAGAQKNIGPAGCALVLIKQEIVDQCPGNLINYLNYANHVKGASMLNTPPVFQVYMIKLVMDWLKAKGGVAWAQQQAETRSKTLYDSVERNNGFYKCPVDAKYRSKMNVVFTTPNADLDAAFVKEADAQGMSGLKGHRSVGGCRASIYNAMPIEGAEALASFMDAFAAKNG
ncbi:MAG: 3-phosphoserine/phosphohydroxythreonine transaminase [Phycisphaeraceae bacterium]|nr:3-phosphoserine/phosphohydroxythreonine transaminase [Phycisphaeraceae bacterium]